MCLNLAEPAWLPGVVREPTLKFIGLSATLGTLSPRLKLVPEVAPSPLSGHMCTHPRLLERGRQPGLPWPPVKGLTTGGRGAGTMNSQGGIAIAGHKLAGGSSLSALPGVLGITAVCTVTLKQVG